MSSKKIIENFVIYFFVFVLVVFLVSLIINFFYIRINQKNLELKISSDYNNLNLYFLKTIKTNSGSQVTVKKYGLVNENDTSSYYITFEKRDGTTNTFIKIGNIIYFDKIKICENVESFKVIVDKTQKETILVETQIKDKIFNSQYVL